MGGVHHAQYFCPGVHPSGRGGPTLILILLVNSKIRMSTPRGLDLSICYILVNILMGNFKLRPWPAIFWRGHRCKKNSEDTRFTPMTASKNGSTTMKLKISYILVKALMGNFQFQAWETISWRGHRCKIKISEFFLHLWPLQKMVLQPQKWKFAINAFTNI